jgi:transportin-1
MDVQALYMSIDHYLQGLFNLAKDPSADVRKLVFTTSRC